MRKKINELSLKMWVTSIKIKRLNKLKNESSSYSEVYGDSHKQNFHYTSDSSEDNHHTRKRKFKPYEENLWGIQEDQATNL